MISGNRSWPAVEPDRMTFDYVACSVFADSGQGGKIRRHLQPYVGFDRIRLSMHRER